MKLPASTICPQIASYSSCEPSTQWRAAGSVSRAIFSTHLRRGLFLLRGTAGSRPIRAEPPCPTAGALLPRNALTVASFPPPNRFPTGLPASRSAEYGGHRRDQPATSIIGGGGAVQIRVTPR